MLRFFCLLALAQESFARASVTGVVYASTRKGMNMTANGKTTNVMAMVYYVIL